AVVALLHHFVLWFLGTILCACYTLCGKTFGLPSTDLVKGNGRRGLGTVDPTFAPAPAVDIAGAHGGVAGAQVAVRPAFVAQPPVRPVDARAALALAEARLLRIVAALAVKPADGGAHAARLHRHVEPAAHEQLGAGDRLLGKRHALRGHAAVAMHDDQPGLRPVLRPVLCGGRCCAEQPDSKCEQNGGIDRGLSGSGGGTRIFLRAACRHTGWRCRPKTTAAFQRSLLPAWHRRHPYRPLPAARRQRLRSPGERGARRKPPAHAPSPGRSGRAAPARPAPWPAGCCRYWPATR